MQEVTDIKTFLEGQWKCRKEKDQTSIEKQPLNYITEVVDGYVKRFNDLPVNIKNDELRNALLVKRYFNKILKIDSEAYEQSLCPHRMEAAFKQAFEGCHPDRTLVSFHSHLVDHNRAATTPVIFERPEITQRIAMWDPEPKIAQQKQAKYRARFKHPHSMEQKDVAPLNFETVFTTMPARKDRLANYSDMRKITQQLNAEESLQHAIATALSTKVKPESPHEPFVSIVFHELVEEREEGSEVTPLEIQEALIRGVDQQYSSIEETFTQEQMRDVMVQYTALMKGTFDSSCYDYANYDRQWTLENLALFKQQQDNLEALYPMLRHRLPAVDEYPRLLEKMKKAIASIMTSPDILDKVTRWNAERAGVSPTTDSYCRKFIKKCMRCARRYCCCCCCRL